MPGPAETRFAELQTVESILSLIGQPEDSHLDCKEWPAKDDDTYRMLARAVCGMANADGGVLVIGMKAESRPKDEPDIISGVAPVTDTSLVASRVLDLVSKLIEPGIVGIQVVQVAESEGSKSGFVVVYVPKSDGSPMRSRKDWKFYQRIGSATLPMEYWQIEDAFGKRPHPKLTLHLRPEPSYYSAALHNNSIQPNFPRWFTLGIKNDGRGAARFPALRCGREQDVHWEPGMNPFRYALPLQSQNGMYFFRGGADSIIYPGELLDLVKVYQAAKEQEMVSIDRGEFKIKWVHPAISFSGDLFAEGMAPLTETVAVAENIFYV